MIKKFLALLTLTVFMAGCGGGGSGKLIPPPPDGLRTLGSNALLLMSDAYIHARRSGQNETFIIDSNCSLTGCRMTNSTFGFSERFTISGVFDNPQDLTADIRLRKTGTRNGVDLYAASGAIPVEDEDFHVSGYGVWMSNSISFVAKGNGTIQDLFLEMGYGMTVGNRSGSIPGGSATYLGAMLGYSVSGSRPGGEVRGDARIDFTLERSDPRLDVSFSNITGASVRDVSWANLPVNRNGTFDSGSINGSFFGPDHEEISGTFHAYGILGTYGTRK